MIKHNCRNIKEKQSKLKKSCKDCNDFYGVLFFKTHLLATKYCPFYCNVHLFSFFNNILNVTDQ